MYDVGCQLGRVWARREASQDQLERIRSIEDGRTWIEGRDDPVGELRQLVDPNNTGFLDVEDAPVPNFVAGFIDGAQSIG